MECPFTRSVWSKISKWVSLSRLHPRSWNANITVSAWFGDLSGALPQTRSKRAKSLIILVCWMVWCERNKRIFDRVDRDWGQLVAVIQGEAHQWIKASASQLGELVDQSLDGPSRPHFCIQILQEPVADGGGANPVAPASLTPNRLASHCLHPSLPPCSSKRSMWHA
jgi:hypothetical protein